MQTFEDQQRYLLDADALIAQYIDPGFLKAKYEALGRQDIRLLENTRTAQRVRLRFAYTEALDMPLPDFARRFMPERQQIEQTVDWDLAAKTGRLGVDAKGSPAKLDATMRLANSADDACVNTIRWTVSVSVPLLGGKLEKLLVEGLRHKARRDQEVTAQLLRLKAYASPVSKS